jgi:Leucine-rich repeat (LRR) protein
VNMDENNMKFVSDKSAMAVTQISSLSLQNSGITRVPGAIQDITLLNVLDLSNNSIHAIETHDFRESSQLLTMKLDNNPILYISDQALSGLINLRKLEMRNVLLKRVPCAIEAMIRNHHPGFILINLSENKLECNCGLKWLYDPFLNFIIFGRFIRCFVHSLDFRYAFVFSYIYRYMHALNEYLSLSKVRN